MGGRSFSDIALQIAGVTVTNLGSGRNKIFVRGLSDGAFTGKTQSTVGLYLDDVPITYSAPDPDLRLADVEQIEVLRGPQGTLYGSGSIGGIVRIVTAAPDPSGLFGSMTVEAGVTQRGSGSNGVEGAINVPLGPHAAVRLVGYRDRRGGYIDNVRLGIDDINRSERLGMRVSGLVELPADWRVQATYAHQSIKTRDSQYIQNASDGLTRDASTREPHDNDFTELGFTASRAGQRVDLKVSAAFIDHAFDSRYDATMALGAPGAAAFDEARSVDLWVAEAVASSAGGGRTRWLAGLFASRADESDDASLVEIVGPRPSTQIYGRRDRLAELAVYGEMSRDLSNRWTIAAGGRLFTNHQTTRMDGFGLTPRPMVGLEGEIDNAGFTPKFRLAYTPRPDIVIYAQVQEGYRTGGFNLPPLADGVSAGASITAFRPDRLRSYEVGAEAPLLHHTITLRAAAFHTEWRSIQTDQYLPSGLPTTVNIGDGNNMGVEVEAAWAPDPHWRLRGNLLLEDPELTRPTDTFPAAADNGLPGVASVMGSVDLRYRWTPWAGVDGELSAQYGYIGHSYLTFDGNRASQMGGYWVGRVAAKLSTHTWSLEGYVDNIADERGNTFAFGNPFNAAKSVQSTPLRPRTFGAALSRRF